MGDYILQSIRNNGRVVYRSKQMIPRIDKQTTEYGLYTNINNMDYVYLYSFYGGSSYFEEYWNSVWMVSI